MDKRYDQTTHCQDKSDENNCKLVIMENYNKNLAPFTVNHSNDEIDEIARVAMAVVSLRYDAQCETDYWEEAEGGEAWQAMWTRLQHEPTVLEPPRTTASNGARL